MSATILSSFRWRELPDAVGRVIDTGLTALGQVWLDGVEVRRGPSGSEPHSHHIDLDDEVRIIVALCFATMH